MIQGWIKANAQVFGESGKKMLGLVRERMADLHAASRSATPASPSGDASKTASSTPSDGDSPPSTSTDSTSSSSES